MLRARYSKPKYSAPATKACSSGDDAPRRARYHYCWRRRPSARRRYPASAHGCRERARELACFVRVRHRRDPWRPEVHADWKARPRRGGRIGRAAAVRTDASVKLGRQAAMFKTEERAVA